MFSKKDILLFLVLALVPIAMANSGFAFVSRANGRVYITDLRGERWEITQAVTQGFKPEGFRHGIGKHAFDPLDESDFDDITFDVPPGRRVIGVADGKEAQAVSVPRLSRHEIANTVLGDEPVAIGY
jgi:hypothetical protein